MKSNILFTILDLHGHYQQKFQLMEENQNNLYIFQHQLDSQSKQLYELMSLFNTIRKKINKIKQFL